MRPLDAQSPDPHHRAERRHTILEGYRDAGKGILLVAGSSIGSSIVALSPNTEDVCDPDWGRFDDRRISTRYSKREQHRLSTWANWDTSSSAPTASVRTVRTPSPENPFLLPEEAENNESPLPPPAPVVEDKPFHIFTKRQKWMVVGIIGTAGLFSGLSSNIYFPSLDAISRVSLNLPEGSPPFVDTVETDTQL